MFSLFLNAGLLACALEGLVGAGALVLPVSGVPKASLGASRLARRADMFGAQSLNNSQDLSYLTNITIGGQTFQVEIDTGSADLWIEGVVSQSTDTGVFGEINYAVGAAAGPIRTATVEFSGYTVQNQPYIQVAPGNNTAGSPGILGLGQNTGSDIFNLLGKKDSGGTTLENIFLQNTTAPNFITTALGRSSDPSTPFPGVVTVGEVMPGYEAVQQQPKLAVSRTTDPGNQHWMTLLDPNGFTVNGKAVKMPKTIVKTTPNPEQLTVVFDDGFSFPQLPKQMADAIYENIPNAQFSNNQGNPLWIVPCTAEVNVTFSFGNVTYPVHPLDTVMDLQLGGGMCAGVFQRNTVDFDFQDMVLGMAFLRNVYMLNNFGDFVDSTAAASQDPFIQLLSTTDPAKAHGEFAAARLGELVPGVNAPGPSSAASAGAGAAASATKPVAAATTPTSPATAGTAATAYSGAGTQSAPAPATTSQHSGASALRPAAAALAGLVALAACAVW